MKKKKFFVLLIILLAIVSVPVFAKNKAGDNFIAGEEVTVNESIDKTSFIAGNNVNVLSEIEGINFVAGNNVTLSSNQEYLFAAGNNINIKELATKDAFVAGNIINIDSSEIRDLYVAGSTITIKSDIERNAYIGGDTVTINSIINGDVTIAAENISISEGTIINGTLKYPKEAEINIAEGASVAATKTYKGTDNVSVTISYKEIIIGKITSFLAKLLVALILFACCKNLFKNIKKEEKTPADICKTAAIGFGVLVLLPFAALIAMITVIGLPVGLLSLILYGVCIYLASIVSSYYVGTMVWNKKETNEFLLLTCSLAVYYVLSLIPFIHGLVVFLSLILGLGIFFNAIINLTKTNKE